MTRNQWLIIGGLGFAVLLVFCCVGIMVMGMPTAPSQSTKSIAMSTITPITIQPVSSTVSATLFSTSTSQPTKVTPIPTSTPTLTPKPITPIDALSKLAKDGLKEGIGGIFLGLRSVAITGTTAVIDYRTTDSVFNQESSVAPFMENLGYIIPQIFTEFSTVSIVEVNQYTMLQDVYGKNTESVSIRIAISRATNSKIDWKGIRPKNLPKILTDKGDSFFVHPALSSGWAIYQQKY